MVLFSGIMRRRAERRVAEAEYKGFARGIAQANANWHAWNQRRLEAAAEGRPFLEPPPSDLPPENQPNRQ